MLNTPESDTIANKECVRTTAKAVITNMLNKAILIKLSMRHLFGFYQPLPRQPFAAKFGVI